MVEQSLQIQKNIIHLFSKQNKTDDKLGRASTFIGVIYKKHMSDRLAIRGGFSIAEIHSSDYWKGSSEYRTDRGKYFTNNIETLLFLRAIKIVQIETNGWDVWLASSFMLVLNIYLLSKIYNRNLQKIMSVDTGCIINLLFGT